MWESVVPMFSISWEHSMFLLSNNQFPPVLNHSWTRTEGVMPRSEEGAQQWERIYPTAPPPVAWVAGKKKKGGSHMPVKHPCLLQQTPILIPSAFGLIAGISLWTHFISPGSELMEDTVKNCISVSWTYLKQTAGRLLSFLSLKVETMLTIVIFLLSTQIANIY